MKIIDVPIDELNPSEYNPRALTEKEYKDLKESLKRFDFVEPIVVNSAENRKNIVIGGHQRLIVAKEMGYETMPVNYVKITKLKREQELNLRLNKNLGHFDYDLLANFDEEMLMDVGFSREELDDVFGLNIDEEFDVDKELEKLLKGKIRRVKDGDLWQLGEHRLIIGDCTNENSWNKLFNEEKFDFMFTDPPYLGIKNFGCNKYKYLSVKKKVEPKDYDSWLSLANLFQNTQGSNILIFESWRNINKLWNAVEKYWKIKNIIIWRALKRYQSYIPKKSFPSRYDPVVLAGNDDKLNESYEKELEEYLKENNQIMFDYCSYILYGQKGNGYWDRRRLTKYSKLGDYIECEVDSSKTSPKEIKGTKPIALLLPYIKILSPRNGTVAEPFCGSGSTIMGCEIMHRRCLAMEIEPLYGELILLRYEKFTGKEAVKINAKSN